MGVYIKGMKKPNGCGLCALLEYCKIDEYTAKPRCCPAIEIAPHGRLIDADALVDTVFHTNIPADTKEFIEDLIGIAPTVIEAEEG